MKDDASAAVDSLSAWVRRDYPLAAALSVPAIFVAASILAVFAALVVPLSPGALWTRFAAAAVVLELTGAVVLLVEPSSPSPSQEDEE